MATKAQAFRTKQQRAANPPKAKQPKRARRDQLVDTSLPGVTATDRKATRRSNRNSLAGRRGGAALEDQGTGRASRKSTRKSADRTKRTTNQQLQAVRKTRSPQARAVRNQAARKTVRGKSPTARSRR
ncbi:MAG: hypothetical protein H0T42_31035 [Deltaproteobacteria bacterium]|nr:hypothetical protein [Deltaproteobacteria bacterium]